MSIFNGKDKSGNISVNFAHTAGLPGFGERQAVNVTLFPDSSTLTFAPRIGKNPPVNLSTSKITDVTTFTEKEIAEKNKSVVGRAAVGALLGPAGAIIGGMSGVGTKKKTTLRSFLSIQYDGGDPIVLEIVGATIGMWRLVDAIRPQRPDSITL